MQRPFLTLAASILTAGGLAVFSGTAAAQDPYHDAYHDDLEHREFHRYLEHRDAHRYPMTWEQHEQLHDELDHQAFHDELEHRQFHRDYYQPYVSPGYGGYYYQPYVSPGYGGYYYQPSYYYPGSGLGLQGRGFSIYFGR